MTERSDNMTFLFEDILKYIGKPKGNEDMRQGLEDIWDQFVDWEDSNTSQSPFDWSQVSIGDHIEPSSTRYTEIRTSLLATILICTSVVGVATNILTIAISLINYRKLNATRVVFMVNLCLSCLLFLVGGMPLILVENVFGLGWNHGETACQLHRYMAYSSFYLISYSIILLLLHINVLMWIPQRVGNIDKPLFAVILCFMFWLLVFLCNIPNYLGHGVSDEIPGISYCYYKELLTDLTSAQAWTTLQFSFTFAVPMCVMLLLVISVALRVYGVQTGEYYRLQTNNGFKAGFAILTVCITITFLICWMPDKILAMYLIYHHTRMGNSLLVVSDMLMCLAYSNPTLNPILILVCILRKFIFCKSRSLENPANIINGTTDAGTEPNKQTQSIINSEDKLIISVV